MERSIESIWKEGFLNNDSLVAPKINNIYNQKSIDIVEKFRKMYKTNIIAIVLFAFALLPFSLVTNMFYMGIMMFILFMVLIYFAHGFKKKLEMINKNTNSYKYIKTFQNWTVEMRAFNSKVSRFLYPYVFISIFSGFWFGALGEANPGDNILAKLITKFPEMITVFGFPLIGIFVFLFIIGLLALIGPKIGEWDLKIVYGRILKRLDVLLNDMEELRNSN